MLSNIYKGGLFVLKTGDIVIIKFVGETPFYRHKGEPVLLTKGTYVKLKKNGEEYAR